MCFSAMSLFCGVYICCFALAHNFLGSPTTRHMHTHIERGNRLKLVDIIIIIMWCEMCVGGDDMLFTMDVHKTIWWHCLYAHVIKFAKLFHIISYGKVLRIFGIFRFVPLWPCQIAQGQTRMNDAAHIGHEMMDKMNIAYFFKKKLKQSFSAVPIQKRPNKINFHDHYNSHSVNFLLIWSNSIRTTLNKQLKLLELW